MMSNLSNITANGNVESKNGEHFANELHKVADMLRLEEKEFLQSYSYLSEKDYYLTIKFILNLIKEHYRTQYPNEPINKVIDTDTFDEMWGEEVYETWGEEFYELIEDKNCLNFWKLTKQKELAQ